MPRRRRPLILIATLALLLPVTAAVAAVSGRDRVVSYAGHTVRVPAGWPVIDFRTTTRGCVLLTRPAVYLGTPATSDCPARAVGAQHAIWLRPTTATAARAAARSTTGAGGGAQHVTGEGFDKCDAAPTSQMRAWLASPMHSVNIYIGGVNRACGNALLTASWVSTVADNGWSLIPTYVGLQAPCHANTTPIDTTNPSGSGAQDATDAVNQMQSLGLGAGNIVYNDMESYSIGNSSCASAVAAYLDAWTTTLHAAGYLSGIYSSAATGIQPLVNAYPSSTGPDDIWIADWNSQDTTSDTKYVPDADWAHSRIHQYANDARVVAAQKTYGGFEFSIDKDVVDGDVSVPARATPPSGPPYTYAVSGSAPESSDGLHERSAPTSSSSQVGTIAEGGQLPIQCQTHGETVHGDPVWDRLADASQGYVSDLYTTTTGGLSWTSGLPRCDTTAPVVSMNPVPTASLSGALAVTWSASDNDSGVASYVVRYRSAGPSGSFNGYATKTGVTKQTFTLTLTPGYDTCVQVAAVDYDGNTSPFTTARCVTRPLDDKSLTAGAGWSRHTASGYYLGTYTSTTSSGRTLRLASARLVRVGIVATKCPTCGTVDVYVGSSRIARFSLYATRTLREQIVLARPFSARSGSVRVISRSSGKTTLIDGLVTSIT